MNTLTLSDVQLTLERLQPDFKKRNYLVAVSGGVDSMVLASVLLALGNNLHVAHVNYKLRAEASDKDQALVEAFCQKHKIPFHLYEVCEEDRRPEGSIQLWARELRYRFFRQILQKENLDGIMTAHHLNDQLETFFINLSRGSGLTGLLGIPENENSLIRPLLSFSKEALLDYAQRNQIPYREDESNAKSDYLRNQIRHKIVPELNSLSENFLDRFQKSITLLKQSRQALDQLLEEKRKALTVSQTPTLWCLDQNAFAEESDFIKYEMLKPFGFRSSEEIRKITTASTGKKIFSESHELWVNRGLLILKPTEDESSKENQTLLLPLLPSESSPANQKIVLNPYLDDLWATYSKNTLPWHIDIEKIKLPLILRRKKEGDVFHPKGMKGKKKVSKFFKDEKLPIFAKCKVWLLCDGNDEILGVLPLRQDRRFASDSHTQKQLTIEIH
ncbi:tRNA lysidine(34) synthetase TilS [Bergeyella sp. RCAD1439]|uniref:tRNA lysidine(34) synthetase TilS n=1 Tax=Bergeyella anatis TaxID=3113737 RepID=UPI002E190BE2|nr:tRNA lysidine(34) synthetase TilS [Bergeyella sp. RCAD1439]